MADPKNIDQILEQLSDEIQSKKLTLTAVRRALASAEDAINKMAISEDRKKELKNQVYIYLTNLLQKAKTKELREWQELEEYYDEIMLKLPEKKPEPKKTIPIEVLLAERYQSPEFTLAPDVSLNDIQGLFNQWLINNQLVNQGFSLVVKASSSAANAFSFAIRGPAENPNAGKLGTFFQHLIANGYIKQRENVVSATPTLHTPTLPKLVPIPIPNAAKKKDEDEEKQSASLSSSKPFGIPTPRPDKN